MAEIVVRLATSDDARSIARIKVDAWRFAYRHILDAALLDGLDLEQDALRSRNRIEKASDLDQMWVACDSESVIGYLVVGPNRFPEAPCDGELQAIYVHPSAHRRGVGRKLMQVGVPWMIERGFESMAVFVFRDNPLGVNFYKSLGAQFHDSGELEIGGKKYADESYIWPSLINLQALLLSQ